MQQFDTPAPVSAVVDVPAGLVRVIAADRADTTVEVRPADASKRRDVERAGKTTVEYADGVLSVVSSTDSGVLGNPGAVEVTVQLPAGSRLGVKTADGDFRAVGRFGDVVFEGAHGPVRIDEAASLRVSTAAGDVSVGRVTGPAEITTAKGDIQITEAVSGTVVLRTQAGDVSVGAAAGASAVLNAGTSYGRIENTLRNTAGSPDLTIHATTAYGDVVARSL